MREINGNSGYASYSMKVFNSKSYRKLPGDTVFIVPYRGDSGEQRISVIHGGTSPYFLIGPKGGPFKKYNSPDVIKMKGNHNRFISPIPGREITLGNFSLQKRSENGIGFVSEYEILKDFEVVSDNDAQNQINGYLMLFNKTRGGNKSSVVLVDGLSELPLDLAFYSGFLEDYAENFVSDHQQVINGFRDKIQGDPRLKKEFSIAKWAGIKRRLKGVKKSTYLESKKLENIGSIDRIAEEHSLKRRSWRKMEIKIPDK